MKSITFNWYTPQEKTPENGEVAILNIYDYTINIANCEVYNGCFNCSSSNRRYEMFPDYWAYIPTEEFKKMLEEKKNCDGTRLEVSQNDTIGSLTTSISNESANIKAQL